ncbi:hypothetical protein PSPO01_15820 [Paraphaeosphaeria sporulosa]
MRYALSTLKTRNYRTRGGCAMCHGRTS